MKFAHFFIERPVFAGVLSIVTIIVGAIAIFTLPIAQYPEIAPPTVTVSASYPGANAKTVAETVATPIEEQVNGVEGMIYMSSQSTNDGNMKLTVTFKLGILSGFPGRSAAGRANTAIMWRIPGETLCRPRTGRNCQPKSTAAEAGSDF